MNKLCEHVNNNTKQYKHMNKKKKKSYELQCTT